MEQKTARLTLLIDPDKKRALEQWCAGHDTTSSQLVRRLIREHLERERVVWQPGGLNPEQETP